MFNSWLFRTVRMLPLGLSTSNKSQEFPGADEVAPKKSLNSEPSPPLKKLRREFLQNSVSPSIGLQATSPHHSESESESFYLSGQSLILSGKTISSTKSSVNDSQHSSTNDSQHSSTNASQHSSINNAHHLESYESDFFAIDDEETGAAAVSEQGTDKNKLNNRELLETVVSKVSPEELCQLKPETLVQLSEKWGLSLKDKIRAEAALETASFNLKTPVNPVEALQSKSEGVSPVITALLALTGKKYTNDPNSPQDIKLATNVLTCLEALEKSSNNNCIPSFSHARTLQQAVNHGAKTFPSQNIGGSRRFFEDGIPLLPIPMLPYGILASDNTQRKMNEIQHFGRMGMNRRTQHNVHTHNVRFVLPDDEKATNEVFQSEEVMPKETIMNCLLRPMDGMEDIIFERFQNDFDYGQEATFIFLEEILEEVLLQQKLGGGLSAMEREVNEQQFGTAFPKFYCTRCPYSQEYLPSQNIICESCGFNGTHYPLEENPYTQTKLPKGPHVEALWVEQEPLEGNPGSRKNLQVIMKELETYWPELFKSFAFAGDALPTMMSAQDQSDSIICLDHNITVALSDRMSLKDHVNCEISIPYENVHFITGESHEELKLNRTALSINWHMGLQSFLLGLGRLTKQSQLAATKSGKLVDLFPITKCFTIGTLQALCVIYLREAAKSGVVPSVDGWLKFAKGSKDLMYLARMKTMVEVNIPVMLKRYAIRNNNAKLADAATALFAPILFVTPSTYYREYVKHKYCNGLPVCGQEGKVVVPKTIPEFLGSSHEDTLQETSNNDESVEDSNNEASEETEDILENERQTSQGLKKSSTGVPTENKLFTKWKNDHRFISFSSLPGEAEGVDFKQEAIIQKVNANMARGKLFDMKVLQKASRLTYLRHCDGQDQTTKRKNPHARYSHEIRSAGTIVLRQAEDPSVKNGLGHLDADVLRLRKNGIDNMKTWIGNRLKAVPGGKIKLPKIALTKEQRLEQEKIENLTKAELIEKIQQLPLLDDEIEMVHKKSATKTYLKNLYYEIDARLIAEKAAKRFNGGEGQEGNEDENIE